MLESKIMAEEFGCSDHRELTPYTKRIMMRKVKARIKRYEKKIIEEQLEDDSEAEKENARLKAESEAYDKIAEQFHNAMVEQGAYDEDDDFESRFED